METVEELHPRMGGRWLVTSQGSTHVWDLDAWTYERRPGPDSPSGPMLYDNLRHRISRVVWWPVVGGQSFLYYDDPANPWEREQFRRSSVITSIERLANPDRPEAESGHAPDDEDGDDQ